MEIFGDCLSVIAIVVTRVSAHCVAGISLFALFVGSIHYGLFIDCRNKLHNNDAEPIE